jgi:hypothetical protein
LWPFGIFDGFWYIFSRVGILYENKSGNPDAERSAKTFRGLFVVLICSVAIREKRI